MREMPIEEINLPLPTLGGKQLWVDRIWRNGWRVQQNRLTGHCRLLDPDDYRRAWGNFTGCRNALRRQAGAKIERACHSVVLVHGMVRSAASLGKLREALKGEGIEVLDYNYPSLDGDVEQHAADLAFFLDHSLHSERVSFVTHSLGGLVVRQALARKEDDWRCRVQVGRLLMIFPPNQGTQAADFFVEVPGVTWLCGGSLHDLTTAGAAALPQPTCDFGIIAGGRGDGAGRSCLLDGDNDGTVRVAETRLDGADFHVVYDVGHTFGMNDSQVVATTTAYIVDGTGPAALAAVTLP